MKKRSLRYPKILFFILISFSYLYAQEASSWYARTVQPRWQKTQKFVSEHKKAIIRSAVGLAAVAATILAAERYGNYSNRRLQREREQMVIDTIDPVTKGLADKQSYVDIAMVAYQRGMAGLRQLASDPKSKEGFKNILKESEERRNRTLNEGNPADVEFPEMIAELTLKYENPRFDANAAGEWSNVVDRAQEIKQLVQ